MANKKIQIKNTTGDNLFPVTKKQCIDDFAHAHSFTGNSITPSGTITLSRSANVALSTTSIGQITGVGSLPTRESKTVVTSAINGASATFTGTVDAGSNATSTGGTEYLEDATITGGGVTPTISYMHWSAGSTPTAGAVNVVTGVSGGGGSRTLSYLHYSAPTATNGSYTPAGSVTLSRSTDVALSTSTISQITGVGTLPTRSSFTYNTLTVSGSTLCVASASAYQITGVGTLPEKAPVSVATGVQTQPNFSGSFAGTATTVVTGISGGSLTANATASGGIKVVSDAAFTNASAATSTIYQITGVGTNPSLTFNSTSSGGQSYVTNVTHTSPSLSKTTKYLHPTITGSVSITTIIAPTTTVSSITGVGTLPTVSTVTIATGVSTQPNFTATFSGDAVTPTGIVGDVQDDLEDPKVNVNTGTFDPTSDNPASQKSTYNAIIPVTLEKLDQSIQDTLKSHTSSIDSNTTLIDKINIGGSETSVGSFKNLLTFVYGSWWEWNADKIIILHPTKQRLAIKQSIVFDQDIMLTASGNLDLAIIYTDEQNKWLDKTYHVKNGSFIVPAGKRFLMTLMPISNPTDIDKIYDNDLYNSMGIYDLSHARSAVLDDNDFISELFLLDSVTGSEALCLRQVANKYLWNDNGVLKYYTKIAFSFVSDTATEIFGLESGIVTDENLIPALEVGKTYPISDLKTKKIVGYCILKKTPEIHDRKFPFENCTLSSYYLPLHENDDILLQLTQYPLIKYPYHNDSFLSIAHQGYWYGTKLNQTRQAYIEALKRGANCLECDLQFTSDGEIVLCHDEYFTNPTTGETYHISQHTLQECLSQDFKVAGYRIMTLREMLTIAKTCGVHLEIDHLNAADTEAKITKVISLIEEFSYWKMVLMNNAGDWQRSKFPDYVTLSYDDDKAGNNSRLPLLATHSVYIFFYSGLYTGTTATVDKDYVLSVKKKGFKVGLWPINDLDKYAEYSQYFDSITSDRYYLPTVMAKMLNEKTPFDRLYVKDDLD